MPKADFIYTDPTIANFTTSADPTPYGIYDSDIGIKASITKKELATINALIERRGYECHTSTK